MCETISSRPVPAPSAWRRSSKSLRKPANATFATPFRIPGTGCGRCLPPSPSPACCSRHALPRRRNQRLGATLAPWRVTPRYTFAALAAPQPHRRPAWRPLFARRPSQAREHFQAARRDGPAWRTIASERLVDGRSLHVRLSTANRRRSAGTLHRRLAAAGEVEPMPRPELTSVVAEVSLPPYLGIPKVQTKDVRGGSLARQRQQRASPRDGQPRPGAVRSRRARTGPRRQLDREPAHPRAGRRQNRAAAGRISTASPGSSRSRCRSPAARTKRRP